MKLQKSLVIAICIILAIGMSFIVHINYHAFNKIEVEQQEANNIIEITSPHDLRIILEEHKNSAIIFLHTPHCGWCTKAEPIFEKLSKNPNFSSIAFYSANGQVTQDSTLIQEIVHEKIIGYPTFLFIHKNEHTEQQIGFSNEKGLKDKIQKFFEV